jgi:hypothetical protein
MRYRSSSRPAPCLWIAAGALLTACRVVPAPVATPAPQPSTPLADCCAPAAAGIAERYRVAAIASRRFTHAELWAAMGPALSGGSIRSTPIGQSVQGRQITALTVGTGPTRVLLWSQMHGDESTASMSLADIVAWLGDPAAASDPLRRRIEAALTVVMVPMLNPDGAELFQRENAVGIDVNRDGRRLVTPEARALKQLRDSLNPEFGFNLHDQNARTLGSTTLTQVGIALLAPAADQARSYGEVRSRARLVAATIADRMQRDIPSRVARYNDAFEPRAFGDLMQQWGTSTVLIESGALPGDPEKQRLRALNVVAILTALDAIATGAYRDADPAVYESLPVNGRTAVDVLVRNASLVLPGREPMLVDLALGYEEPVAKLRPRVREVGDLTGAVALDTLDARGLFLHPMPQMLMEREGVRWLRIDAPAAFWLRRGADPASQLVQTVGGR